MKINFHQAALLASTLTVALAASSAAQTKKGDYTAKVKVSPAAPKVGQNTSFTLTTTSKAPLNGVVMLGVYDAKDKRVGNKDWQKEKLTKGQRTYKWDWTPKTKGVYTVKTGIFGPKWKPTHYFGWRDAKFTVK